MSDDIRKDIAEYLKTKGWNVILVAEHGVQKPDPTPLKYQYVMNFMGKNNSLERTKINHS